MTLQLAALRRWWVLLNPAAPCNQARVDVDDDGMERSRCKVQFQHLRCMRLSSYACGTNVFLPGLQERVRAELCLAAVVQHDRDHVAAAHAVAAQEVREARGAEVELPVRQRGVIGGRGIDHSKTVGLTACGAQQDVPGILGACCAVHDALQRPW